jgi:nucleotide-binding universal stress UspA family protein
MRTLIAIRELPFAETTIQMGGLIARLQKRPITLMTVIDSESERSAAQTRLAQARSLLQEPDVELLVLSGRPQKEILQEADEADYDLVVVGAHEIGSLFEAITGTVTTKIADHARASVLVARSAPERIARILICTAGREASKDAVLQGAQLASRAEAHVTLLHVTNPVPSMYTGLEAIEERLDEMLQTDTPIARHLRWGAKVLDDAGVEANLELRHGIAADEILREAHQGDYDLIIIGARSLPGAIRRLLMDDVVAPLVDRSPCSIMIVRQ